MSAQRVVRFGVFEFDVTSGELRKEGRRVGLQSQPAQILAQLVSNPGCVMTREELRRTVWPENTFVDFDTKSVIPIRRWRGWKKSMRREERSSARCTAIPDGIRSAATRASRTCCAGLSSGGGTDRRPISVDRQWSDINRKRCVEPKETAMNSLALVLAVITVVAAADSPFVGKWKLNLEKSQFTGTTMTFEPLPSGEMRATVEGQSYSFKTDGKEYPAIFGSTAAWNQLDANTWQATYKARGTVLSTDTIKVSPDGKMLTVSAKGTKPDGASFETTAEYQRVAGTTGLAGKWKSTKVAMSSPETMEFAPSTGDGVMWTVPAYKITADLKFDGKDYPVKGPTVPANFTIAATSKGARSFELIEKVNGKIVYRGTYTLSEDGKTLTAAFSAEGTNEKVTAVYDRQ